MHARTLIPLLVTIATAWVAGIPVSDAAPAGSIVVQVVAPPHGLPLASDAAADEPAEVSAVECAPQTRATTDRVATKSGRLIHVVYLKPSDVADGGLDVDGSLSCSVAAAQQWTISQSSATGSALGWRWDTYLEGGTERIDVTYVASSLPSGSLNSASEVSAELKARGFNVSTKRYLSYVESNAGGVCGDAFYPITAGTAPVDGQYSQVYLRSVAECHPRDLATSPTAASWVEAVVLQEMIHNDGVVPLLAPHDCVAPYQFHVCTGPLLVTPTLDPESADVMFPFVTGPLSGKVLDRGNEDYFRHPFPWIDLDAGLYIEPV